VPPAREAPAASDEDGLLPPAPMPPALTVFPPAPPEDTPVADEPPAPPAPPLPTDPPLLWAGVPVVEVHATRKATIPSHRAPPAFDGRSSSGFDACMGPPLRCDRASWSRSPCGQAVTLSAAMAQTRIMRTAQATIDASSWSGRRCGPQQHAARRVVLTKKNIARIPIPAFLQ
jgi:hypothetical protein